MARAIIMHDLDNLVEEVDKLQNSPELLERLCQLSFQRTSNSATKRMNDGHVRADLKRYATNENFFSFTFTFTQAFLDPNDFTYKHGCKVNVIKNGEKIGSLGFRAVYPSDEHITEKMARGTLYKPFCSDILQATQKAFDRYLEGIPFQNSEFRFNCLNCGKVIKP